MNAKPLIFIAAIAALILGAGAANAAAPVFTPDAAAEVIACSKAVADKPVEWDGILQGNVGQVEWLSRVAFHRAYGRWPNPASPVEADRLAQILICVSTKLGPNVPIPPPNLPPPDPPQLPPVAPAPTPGMYYAIKAGDQLLGAANIGGVTAAAYKTAGAANLAASKKINNHPLNQRFVRPIESLGLSEQGEATEKKWYPNGRITFAPVFGDFAQQLADATNGSQGMGGQYAIVFIPE